MPRPHLRSASSPVYYTETECLNCAEIIAVAWQYQHANLYAPSTALATASVCPICSNTRLETRHIDQKTFDYITENWDLMVAGELEPAPDSTGENVIDLSSLFEDER